MKNTNSNYQTLKEAGYKFIASLGGGEFLLWNIEDRNIENFNSRKNVAGWAIKYKNTHLEFASSYNPKELAQFRRGMQEVAKRYSMLGTSKIEGKNAVKILEIIK